MDEFNKNSDKLCFRHLLKKYHASLDNTSENQFKHGHRVNSLFSHFLKEESHMESTVQRSIKKILLVDDEFLIRFKCKFWLEKESNQLYSVVDVENANIALKLLSGDIFDMVIADSRLPDMDCLDFTERVKTISKQKTGNYVPLIIMNELQSVSQRYSICENEFLNMFSKFGSTVLMHKSFSKSNIAIIDDLLKGEYKK